MEQIQKRKPIGIMKIYFNRKFNRYYIMYNALENLSVYQQINGILLIYLTILIILFFADVNLSTGSKYFIGSFGILFWLLHIGVMLGLQFNVRPKVSIN